MNIQVLILGIFFACGGQSLEAAAMPQLSPADQLRLERRLAEQRAKADQAARRTAAYQSIAPSGEELQQLQTTINRELAPTPVPRGPRQSPSGSTSASSSSTRSRTPKAADPAAIATTLRQVGAYAQCAYPIANSLELQSFARALARSQSGKYLFTGNNFTDATVSNVLRSWATRFPEGKAISKPADLKDWAHFYHTLATNPDTRALAQTAQRIDANQPGLSFEEALKKITLRYADILTDNNNKRDFSTYKKNISPIIESTKPVRLNKDNKILDAYVDNIITGIKSQNLIFTFIYAVAANQWNKENRSNPNAVTEEQFQQMVVNSAIAVLDQMKQGISFELSMYNVFREFYLAAASSSSSSPDQPLVQF